MATFRETIEGLFGWQAQRTPEEQTQPISFTPKDIDDGALNIAPVMGAMGTVLDLDNGVRSDIELINRYRTMAEHPEVDAAIEEICNEMVSGDEPDTVKIVLDDLQQSAKVKQVLEEVFDEVMELLDFRRTGYDLVRRWYTDARVYMHAIIDPKNPSAGLQEVRYIDPRKIKKVREVEKIRVKNNANNAQPSGYAVVTRTKAEYYVYNDAGFQPNSIGDLSQSFGGTTGLKIAPDTIIYVTSGLTDPLGTRVVGYLQKAVKPLNQLRMLEDASIIYRLSRAPQRRIWKIEIGNQPKLKGEQYIKDIMTKHKNRLVYDSNTGEIRDDRKFQTILEDFWIPTRNGVGTSVETLPPAVDWGVMDDILYFERKLYGALKVPVGRLSSQDPYDIGVATQITRDELKFAKFVDRLQNRFSQLFIKIMERQCVLKGIMSLEDFNKIAPFIRFEYVKDNMFDELKDQQIWNQRAVIATELQPFVGRHISNTWLRKKVFHQTDDDIAQIDAEIQAEAAMPQYAPPEAPTIPEQKPPKKKNEAVETSVEKLLTENKKTKR